MKNGFITDFKWNLIFINFFLIIFCLQGLSDKIERLEEKSDKVLKQCDSLQNKSISNVMISDIKERGVYKNIKR